MGNVELWQAAIAAAVTAIGAGFFSRRSKGERDSSSAKDLAVAYGGLIDDLRKARDDDREQIRHLRDEQSALRAELRSLRETRDTETAALRQELATVREDLRLERLDNRQLRDRIAALEASRRSSDVAA